MFLKGYFNTNFMTLVFFYNPLKQKTRGSRMFPGASAHEETSWLICMASEFIDFYMIIGLCLNRLLLQPYN